MEVRGFHYKWKSSMPSFFLNEIDADEKMSSRCARVRLQFPFVRLE